MTARLDAWRLPASEAFLTSVQAGLARGLVLVRADAARPAGLERELREFLRGVYPDVFFIDPEPGQAPAAALARPLGARPSLESLLAPALDQILMIVRVNSLAAADIASWRVFAKRFHVGRTPRDMGPVCLFLDVPDDLCESDLPVALAWADHLRRLDLTIWADLHTTPGRDALVTGLASALASELCVWRLDLGQALARASIDDLANPLDWLKGRPEPASQQCHNVSGRSLACPLALLARGELAEIDRRIWHAHLVTLFPLIEEGRQRLIDRHKKHLRLDDHLRGLGVRDVEEIELGALRRQLTGRVGAAEKAWINMLADMRNRLAHRRPVDSEQLRFMISVSARAKTR